MFNDFTICLHVVFGITEKKNFQKYEILVELLIYLGSTRNDELVDESIGSFTMCDLSCEQK